MSTVTLQWGRDQLIAEIRKLRSAWTIEFSFNGAAIS